MEAVQLEYIQPQLEVVEARMLAQLNRHPSELVSTLEQIIGMGGKRVRPRVTLLMGKVLGAHHENLLDLAAAVEMLHTATLVHDDLIDGALLRRGADTLNAQWTPAATVLAGDLVFAVAAQLAAATNSVDVMRMFAETLQIIVGGEIGNLFRQPDESGYWRYLRTTHTGPIPAHYHRTTSEWRFPPARHIPTALPSAGNSRNARKKP